MSVSPIRQAQRSASKRLMSVSITDAAAAGTPPAPLQARAGHSDYSTTQLYIDLAGETFREEAERLEERLSRYEGKNQPCCAGADRRQLTPLPHREKSRQIAIRRWLRPTADEPVRGSRMRLEGVSDAAIQPHHPRARDPHLG